MGVYATSGKIASLFSAFFSVRRFCRFPSPTRVLFPVKLDKSDKTKTGRGSCPGRFLFCLICQVSREKGRASARGIGKTDELKKMRKKGLQFCRLSRILPHRKQIFKRGTRDRQNRSYRSDATDASPNLVVLCRISARLFCCFLKQTRIRTPSAFRGQFAHRLRRFFLKYTKYSCEKASLPEHKFSRDPISPHKSLFADNSLERRVR